MQEHGDAIVAIERPEEASAESDGAERTPQYKPRPILAPDENEDDLQGREAAKTRYLDHGGPGQERLPREARGLVQGDRGR